MRGKLSERIIVNEGEGEQKLSEIEGEEGEGLLGSVLLEILTK